MEDIENIEDQNTAKYSRRSRTADTREANSRESEARAPIVFGRGSQFNLEESVLTDKRYQFGWLPTIQCNEEVTLPYDNAIRDGWECVEASQYSGLKRVYKHDPFSKKRAYDDDLIRKGGQVLMRRSVELKEAEEKYYDEERAHADRLLEMHREKVPGGLHVFTQSRKADSRPIY